MSLVPTRQKEQPGIQIHFQKYDNAIRSTAKNLFTEVKFTYCSEQTLGDNSGKDHIQ
jgi:hypothetical protein